LFIGDPDILPLAEMPILGRLCPDASAAQVRDLLALVRRSSRGGCVQVSLGSHEAAVVRSLGQQISRVLAEGTFPQAHPLVFLVKENVGKVFGQYVTRWGTLPVQVLVIDEVTRRDAQYVQIGALRNQVVPVSFYGLHP
jgi:ethanolamine utilization protein EutA